MLGGSFGGAKGAKDGKDLIDETEEKLLKDKEKETNDKSWD